MAALTKIPARNDLYQGAQTLTLDSAYNTTGISSGVWQATLPKNGEIVDIKTKVIEAYNAGSTNVLVVGTASDDDAFVAAGDVTEGTIGVYPAGDAAYAVGVGYIASADTPIYVKYTQTGTAASAGSSRVTITYVHPNDGRA